MTKLRRRILAAVLATLAVVGLSFMTASSASASYGVVNVTNFSSSRASVGVVTQWTTPNRWQVLVSPGWRYGPAVGAYVGSGYCLSVYYSWNNRASWVFQYTARGAQYVSFPGWQINDVGLYAYQC